MIKPWKEIYNKFENIELMKEFMWFYCGENKAAIKDIWRYLIWFAETKDIIIEIAISDDKYKLLVIAPLKSIQVNAKHKLEQKMLWSAEKFFEYTRC